MSEIVEKLYLYNDLSDLELKELLSGRYDDELREKAELKRIEIYGKDVYIRGLIEISNYCKNNCNYCGIRAGNSHLNRYRLSKDEILDCCKKGYSYGFRTFVIQGGEDNYFTDGIICDIVYSIKSLYPDCAVTLSLGEKSKDSYKSFKNAGADRYLLRHETADKTHYGFLHPANMSFDNRIQCLYNLKELGFQTGCGFMVGSPNQTADNLVKDLRFIKEFEPQMVGIGPFVPHSQTPFSEYPAGSLKMTLRLLSLIRLLLPNVLLPSTTALGTIHPKGREMGIKAGANVVMPNLSPTKFRKLYSLYDNKICTGDEAAECIKCMSGRVSSIGYKIVVDRGDFISPKK